MRGDYSRSTFDSKKHYSSVRMQQGRLQLDSDWNESEDIRLHHERAMALDAIGPAGGPKENAGFLLSYDQEKGDLWIGRGRYYVDGVLCENESDLFCSEQPSRPQEIKELPKGRYMAYLDVWESAISAVEDPAIRELALGGPDTALRTKVMWRVEIEQLSKPFEYIDERDLDMREASLAGQFSSRARQPARMAARIERGEGSSKICSISINDRYGYLGNNLYRVEIQEPGRQGVASFKWSRDNGSIVRSLENIDRKTITLLDPARNCAQIFHPGQYVEITDDLREARGENGEFRRIEAMEGLRLTLERDIDPQSFSRPKVLLWDGVSRPTRKKGGWMKIEVIGEDEIRILSDEKIKPGAFAPGQRVEISNDPLEMDGSSLFAKILEVTRTKDTVGMKASFDMASPTEVKEGTRSEDTVSPKAEEVVRLKLADIKGKISLNKLDVSGNSNPRVRRWDASDEWIDLEMDIKVAFHRDDEYQRGDFWLIPSREVTGRIEWPLDKDGKPEFLDRRGVIHHLARIAYIEYDKERWIIHDLRHLFPALGGRLSIEYGGGDGQLGRTGELLKEPFRVLVMHEGTAASGEEVLFRIKSGEGKLLERPGEVGYTNLTVKSDERGGAQCYCRIESEEVAIEAVLGSSPDIDRLKDEKLTDPEREALFSSRPVLHFLARAVAAEGVSYRLPQDYPEAGEARTVKEALDRFSHFGRAESVSYRPPEDAKKEDDIKSVGEALDDLYHTVLTRACAVSIGEGGEYRRLDEALSTLIEQKKSDICLCLMPGRHSLEKSLFLKRAGGQSAEMRSPDEMKEDLVQTIEVPLDTHISIKGSGRGSKILLDQGKRIILEGLESLCLENLEIEGEGQKEGLLTIKSIDYLSLKGCHIRATGDRASGEGIALSIKNGEGVLNLDGNQIEGLLCLYEGDGRGEFKLKPGEADNLEKRACLLLGKVRGGTLNLCNNQIKRIAVGDKMALLIKKQLAEKQGGKPVDGKDPACGTAKMEDIFHVIILSNNVITSGPNLLLSGNLIFSGNFFERQTANLVADGSPEMNWAISCKSVFTGNIGEETKITCASDAMDKSANLLEIREL